MQQACSSSGVPASSPSRCIRSGRPAARALPLRRRATLSWPRHTCRSTDGQEPQPAAAEEAPYSPPKFLFDEDPPPPSARPAVGGPDLLAANSAFVSASQSATSRPSGSTELPQPPPETPAEQPAQESSSPDGGPKFLFDELPEVEGAPTGGPDLISANPAFASVLKSALARQDTPGGTGNNSMPQQSSAEPAAAQAQPRQAPRAPPSSRPPPPPEEQPASAAEEVLHAALRDSRRTLLVLQRMHEELGASIKREESQFNRLHFALQKARSDAARMAAMQRMLDNRRQ